MITFLMALTVVSSQLPDSVLITQQGIRNPTISSAGRLAYEVEGDLWVVDLGLGDSNRESDLANPAVPAYGSPIQVTSGPEWDRQPSWTHDGESLVFASDRNGGGNLWKIVVGVDGQAVGLSQLTHSDENDSEPASASDGGLVFARGAGESSDLWMRSLDGAERQLTSAPGREMSPTVSPDGSAVAYVSVLGGRRELRVHQLSSGADDLVLHEVAVEYPTWHPNGEVLAFTTRTGRRGVWVTPRDGSYVNLVTELPGFPVWSPDGDLLIMATLPRSAPGYNGDPHRLGSAPEREGLSRVGSLWITPAPTLPGKRLAEMPLKASVDRTARHVERFDRVWELVNRLYFRDAGQSEWARMRSEYRPRSLRASSDSALESLVHEMLSRRPHLREEVRGRAAVSSAHSLASAAGAEMLRRGGNVIDAAVATSFAIGVVEPDASGMGGYGEMVLFLNGMESPVVIEFLTRVPEQAGLNNAALLVDGSLPPDGPVLANIPGTVAGMWTAWNKYGSGHLEWAELIQPAIELAEQGFVLDEAFTTTLGRERHRFEKYESSMRLFFPGGNPLLPGDTLKNADMAWTLRQIAAGGADAFYRGEIAKRLVADLRGQGNAMTLTDMDRYFAVEREPVSGSYHGHTVYSAAPAAGGGVSLVAKLNLLENVEATGLHRDDPASLHAMIEAWKLTPSTGGRLADPSLWPIDLEPLLDAEGAQTRWRRCFDPGRATGPDDLRQAANGEPACAMDGQVGFSWGERLLECVTGDEAGCRSSGTTAFTVADADGNIVAVTQTLGTWGGNFYVTPGLGFLYNDKLRSYRADPKAYGARIPYARHGTSIAPTIVFEGTGESQFPKFAVAAAGNAWITSAVYQMVVAMIDQRLGPQDALELPRFLVGSSNFGTDTRRSVLVQLEDGFSTDVMWELERLGHDVQLISLRGELRMGYGAAVLIEGGAVRAGADPRRSGGAIAVR